MAKQTKKSVVRTTHKIVTSSLDLRTPSGKMLPY